jgi:type II secretory pathway pseudopilin PulG
MLQSSPIRRARSSEEGYVLVAVVFMTVILVLALAVALPRVRESIQRDRDLETMERGKQYIRAVQLYYRKFHAYPPNVDALVKTNDIRFLRKKYVDPTTGKDEWKPVLFGQNKTPQAMGFFGQPLAAAAGAGIGPSGGNGLTGTGTTGAGATTSAGGGLFNTSTTTGSMNSGTGSAGATGGTTGGTDTGSSSTTGGGSGGTSTPTGGSPGSSGSTNGPTSSGQTFGGAGIIGFSPQSPKQSLYVYKKKNHYKEWEFLYSPLMDQQTMGGGNTGTIGQPASGTTTPIGSGTGTGTTPNPTPPVNPSSSQQ